MRIRIVDADTQETWLYNVQWNLVRKSVLPHERLYIMDDAFLDKIAIDMAVRQFFGTESTFWRDTSIRDYICGEIVTNTGSLRTIYAFFES